MIGKPYGFAPFRGAMEVLRATVSSQYAFSTQSPVVYALFRLRILSALAGMFHVQPGSTDRTGYEL